MKDNMMICPKAKECPVASSCIGQEAHPYGTDCNDKSAVIGLPVGWICPACIPYKPEPCPLANIKINHVSTRGNCGLAKPQPATCPEKEDCHG